MDYGAYDISEDVSKMFYALNGFFFFFWPKIQFLKKILLKNLYRSYFVM